MVRWIPFPSFIVKPMPPKEEAALKWVECLRKISSRILSPPNRFDQIRIAECSWSCHSCLWFLSVTGCRRTHNSKVGGSNPPPATKQINYFRDVLPFHHSQCALAIGVSRGQNANVAHRKNACESAYLQSLTDGSCPLGRTQRIVGNDVDVSGAGLRA